MQDISNFPLKWVVCSSTSSNRYCGIIDIMDFLLSYVAEEFVWDHHILPGDGFVKFELYLIYLVSRLHVDEEVCMVEDSVN